MPHLGPKDQAIRMFAGENWQNEYQGEGTVRVPTGDAADEKRLPGSFDVIADYLGTCGVR